MTGRPTTSAVASQRQDELWQGVGQYLKSIGRVAVLTPAQQVELAKRIEAGLFAGHRLDHAETAGGGEVPDQLRAELEEIVRDGQQAKQHMVEGNLRLVVATSRRYVGRGLEFADLISEGNVGLIRAVEKFDHAKGYMFSTYATWWIVQAIQRAIADKGRTIRLPAHMREVLSALRTAERGLEQHLNRRPTAAELAGALGKTHQQVEHLLRVRQQPISLDIPIDDAGRIPLADAIEDIDVPDPVNIVADQQLGDALRQVLAVLPDREAKIIALRYGLVDGRPHSLEEVGQAFKLSRERIRQLEKNTLARLRTPEMRARLRDWRT
ncbi:sigma-70 family RNA polymerase sigma factor [Sphaerisporangium viridialbum]|uniref:sigma-70 family RNA polymerase sigma factor n=1 Tax=Sphaerisporangium viridialbum TaxID=46189 RepID=UPI003C77C360